MSKRLKNLPPTEYTHRIVVCTPVDLIYDANQLACIVGESAADINTFTETTHTREGVEYACISTVVKDVFGGYLTTGLPDPPHAAEADRTAASLAFSRLNQEGQIVFDLDIAKDTSSHEMINRLGFIPIPHEDEDEEFIE